ncbi:MAG: DNA topoisomerase I, partial [Planctomycetota bacterium]
VCTIPIGTAPDGEPVVVRVGRYGPYLQHGDDTASLPPDTVPDELTVERALELLEVQRKGEQPLGHHPETGEPIYVKSGRYGPYVQLGDASGDKKPKIVSLLRGMDPKTITLETACKLLELPRTLGHDEQGNPVVVHLGRYGPYIKRGEDTRSLTPDDDPLTIGLERALELLAQPKRSSRRGPEPIRSLGVSERLGGTTIQLMNGRYGPYVTDGEVNASLPRDRNPEEIGLADAEELIEARRARLASGGGRGRKTAARKKKSSKKKTASKKSTKKKANTKKKTSTKKKAATKKTARKKTAAARSTKSKSTTKTTGK